jgi:hypothetical protein
MAHFKAKKTRRQVRCTMCTSFRWLGNSARTWGTKSRQAKANRNRIDKDDLE